MNPDTPSPGTLKPGEAHPSAYDAARWVRTLPAERLATYQESLSSCSISGNRLAEVCSETLRRFLSGKPVSDRYLLGLAWALRGFEDQRASEPALKRRRPHRGTQTLRPSNP